MPGCEHAGEKLGDAEAAIFSRLARRLPPKQRTYCAPYTDTRTQSSDHRI